MARWRYASDTPVEVDPAGQDAVCLRWELERDGDSCSVVVAIPGSLTKKASPQRHVAEAIESAGRSVVDLYLDWELPPARATVRENWSEPEVILREAD